MNGHDDLIERLRALGRRPVSPDVAGGHLAAMDDSAVAASGGAGRHRLRVVAAFAVGLLAGTSGLATAGALPHSAQEVARRSFGAVGINVPHGDRYQGPECGGAVKNHGQYVRSQPKEKRAEAAKSRCGKPVQAGTGDDADDPGVGARAECHGPPPWAGKGKPDPAAKAARKQACGADEDRNESEKVPAPAAGSQPGVSVSPETAPSAGPPETPTSRPTPATGPTTPTTATGPTDTSGPPATTPPVTVTPATTPSPGSNGDTPSAGSGGDTPSSTAVDPPVAGQGS